MMIVDLSTGHPQCGQRTWRSRAQQQPAQQQSQSQSQSRRSIGSHLLPTR